MVLSLVDQVVLLDRLEDEVRVAAKPSSGLFSKIIASLCTRIPALDRAGRTGRIRPLLETQAWTEAALTLIQCELPAWQVRRMVHDGAEWICSLSPTTIFAARLGRWGGRDARIPSARDPDGVSGSAAWNGDITAGANNDSIHCANPRRGDQL
jgi:hypothetical protein